MRRAGRNRITAGALLGALSLACAAFALTTILQGVDFESALPRESSATAPSYTSAESTPDAGASGTAGVVNPLDSGTSDSSAGASSLSNPETSPESPAPQVPTITVSILVDSSAATGLGFPATMASGTMELPAGTSAYDALARTGLSLGGSSSYVSSINGLAEKAMGATSGWTYSVNGSTPMTAACNYALESGDSLCWRYVT